MHGLMGRPPEAEKITVNLGHVDLGHVDLLVHERFYANRADFIRTAIRNQLDRHGEALRTAVARNGIDLGLCRLGCEELAQARDAGAPLRIRVLGLVTIAPDVSPDLARAGIASISVLGALHASPAVRTALADRMV